MGALGLGPRGLGLCSLELPWLLRVSYPGGGGGGRGGGGGWGGGGGGGGVSGGGGGGGGLVAGLLVGRHVGVLRPWRVIAVAAPSPIVHFNYVQSVL